MSEVKNRRENLFINEVPPEVLTADDVEDAALEAVADAGYLTVETAATAGFVKNTDYASSSTAGVVKVSSQRATSVSASGLLQATTLTGTSYNDLNQYGFIAKGTLEGVIGSLVKRELIALLGGADTDAVGTTLTGWFAERTADGWNVVAVKSVPTPP